MAKKDPPLPVLSQFPEGFLGKLQIRRSGKVELRLGDVVMDVSEGAAFSFLQVIQIYVVVSLQTYFHLSLTTNPTWNEVGTYCKT